MRLKRGRKPGVKLPAAFWRLRCERRFNVKVLKDLLLAGVVLECSYEIGTAGAARARHWAERDRYWRAPTAAGIYYAG
jgi:hypothetical protein